MTSTALPPTGLLVDLLRRPEQITIHRSRPSFSWVVNDSHPQAHQTAFQIRVASSVALLYSETDLWDSGDQDPGSGWQTDSRSLHVPYDGKALEPDTPYWWMVRTWNDRNQPSPWSQPQRFITGDLDNTYHTPRQALTKTGEAPRQVVVRDDGVVFMDFGKDAFGTLYLTLTADSDGEITLRLGEVLADPFTVHRNPGGSRRFRSLTLAIKDGTHTYELEIPPDARNTRESRNERQAAAILMPPEIGEVLPFRYVELEGPVQPPLADHVCRLSVYYPLDENDAEFNSSSDVLDDVWDMCLYSMKATSFCAVHVDGDRERIPYEGDCYINQLGVYGCQREYALSRYSHEYLIHNPTWPTEWVLFSVQTAWLDYLYTGESSSIEHFYDDLKAKTLRDLARPDGLISTVTPEPPARVLEDIHFHPEWTIRDIVDWPQGERDHFDMRPVNTVVNAFHWRALVLMQRIAEALDRPKDAFSWEQRAKAVRAAMLDKLVDSERNLFVDGEGSSHCSLHASVFPLAFGLTPESMIPDAVAMIRSKGMACSVYVSQFLLEALYRGDDEDTAMALMTSTAERSWAAWIYDVGTTISLEAWGDRFKPNQDWNHAWGATPANIIPRFVLGVRPASPGFESITIDPRPGQLTHVEGTVPTIRGPVGVSVDQTPGMRFVLKVCLPANSSGRIAVPRLHNRDLDVTLDGRTVSAVPCGDRLLVDGIGSGEHTIVRA